MMKQGVASAKNGGNGSYSVIPPSNFSYIEESICRCSLPLNRQNIAFLQSTSINFVVNISGKKFEPAVVTYFEDKSIDTVRFSNFALLSAVNFKVSIIVAC